MGIERLTLIERPCLELPPELRCDVVSALGDLALRTSVVVGMTLRERPPIFMVMANYAPTDTEYRRPLRLRSGHARRLAELFTAYRASATHHDYNNISIMRYVLGMGTVSMQDPGSREPLRYASGSRTQLELGEGYAFLDSEGAAVRLAYGLDDPRLCLTSLGLAQSLIVTPVKELWAIQGISRIAKIVPDH